MTNTCRKENAFSAPSLTHFSSLTHTHARTHTNAAGAKAVIVCDLDFSKAEAVAQQLRQVFIFYFLFFNFFFL
jgi:hypothetical protein